MLYHSTVVRGHVIEKVQYENNLREPNKNTKNVKLLTILTFATKLGELEMNCF